MKISPTTRTLLFLACLLVSAQLLAAEQDPSTEFVDARLLIHRADKAAQDGEWIDSFRGYQVALVKLQQIANTHPHWQPAVIQFRTAYCTAKLEEVGPRVPKEIAAAPPPEPQVVPTEPPAVPPTTEESARPEPPAVTAQPVIVTVPLRPTKPGQPVVEKPRPTTLPKPEQPERPQAISSPTVANVADGSPMPVTLNDCLVRALQHNLAVRVKQLEPEIERWGLSREQGVYDPVFEIDLSYQDKSEPLDPERALSLSTSAPDGVIDEKGWRFRSGIIGRLQPGTRYEVIGTDTTFEGTLAPENVHVGDLSLVLTQPLLKNFGRQITEAGIRIARQDILIAEHQFRQEVNDTIAQVVIAYYQLVYRIEDLKAKEDDLARARQLLEDNQKRAKGGLISSLEVIQARAGVAEREEAVITAANTVRETENALKRLISSELSAWGDTALQPSTTTIIEARMLEEQEIISAALEANPVYLSAIEEVKRQGIQVEFRRNQLYPEVDLRASVGVNARSGTRTASGSFGEFLDEVGSGDYPVWSVGVLVRIPLGNRQARGEYERAQLRADQGLLKLKAIEQDVVLQVKNIVGRIRANHKRIEAAVVASELAEASLDAEQSKYQRGTSTSFLVLQAQSQVAAAKSIEIGARADLLASQVELARIEGTLPSRYGIEIEE